MREREREREREHGRWRRRKTLTSVCQTEYERVCAQEREIERKDR